MTNYEICFGTAEQIAELFNRMCHGDLIRCRHGYGEFAYQKCPFASMPNCVNSNKKEKLDWLESEVSE